jgi:hypothetical protein
LAASVPWEELNASSLFLNQEQSAVPQERAVWANRQEEQEDVAQLQAELMAV